MRFDASPMQQLASEHCALLHQYGEVQMRCSALLSAQAKQINQLRAQNVRLRAAVIVRDTALSWAIVNIAPSAQAHARLARNAIQNQYTGALLRRLHDLLRKLLLRPLATRESIGQSGQRTANAQRAAIQNGPA